MQHMGCPGCSTWPCLRLILQAVGGSTAMHPTMGLVLCYLASTPLKDAGGCAVPCLVQRSPLQVDSNFCGVICRPTKAGLVIRCLASCVIKHTGGCAVPR